MTRGTAGDGSIYKTSDGRWRGAVVLPSGERRYLSGKTRAVVAAKRRELLRAIEAGQPVSSRKAGTLAAYLESWLTTTLPTRVATGRLSPDTLASYRHQVQAHVLPHLGQLRMDQLTPPVLRRWMMTLLDKPRLQQSKAQPGQPAPAPVLLSARTVTYTHAVLRAALNDALRDEVPGLRRNVAELVSPPPKAPSTARPLDLSSLPLVLAAMEQHRWRPLWLTYLGLGLRKGEALGLAWPDIDLEAGLVSISRSLRRRDGQLVDGPVKTSASGATIPVPAPLVQVLLQHRTEQRRERLAAVTWAESERVFTTSRGTALEPRNVNTEWAKVCAAAGIEPIRLHDLRHSMATFALRQGVELKTIQTMLRHSRLATTADLYTHVLQEVQRSGADRIGDLLTEFGVGRDAASPAMLPLLLPLGPQMAEPLWGTSPLRASDLGF